MQSKHLIKSNRMNNREEERLLWMRSQSWEPTLSLSSIRNSKRWLVSR